LLRDLVELPLEDQILFAAGPVEQQQVLARPERQRLEQGRHGGNPHSAGDQ